MTHAIEVVPASAEQQPILANLLELYAHDFSEFLDIELDADGRFGYPDLPLYWRDPGRHPFLITCGGKLAGFILVKRAPGDDAVWDMAEFFVVRSYRNHGIGTNVAHKVWRRFPGRWQVRVMESNRPANRFWERAVRGFAGEAVRSASIETHGKSWRVFSFDAPSP